MVHGQYIPVTTVSQYLFLPCVNMFRYTIIDGCGKPIVIFLFVSVSLEALKKINKIIHYSFILILLLVKHITGTYPVGHDANEQKHDDMDYFCCTKA